MQWPHDDVALRRQIATRRWGFGQYPTTLDQEDVDSADLADPTGAIATSTIGMSPRYGHTAVRLADGRVLLSGGNRTNAKQKQAVLLADAQLFDPVTGTFTQTGSMLRARVGHLLTLLASGDVLVTGGSSADPSQTSTELFDPTRGRFEAAGTMIVTRSRGYTVTALTDGRALIVGGVLSDLTPTAAAELFE